MQLVHEHDVRVAGIVLVADDRAEQDALGLHAVDRDERVADRADAGDRVVQDDPLDPVRQLEGDHIAGLDAQLEQAQRAAVYLLPELAVADLAAGIGEGHLVGRAGGDLVQIVGDDLPGPAASLGVGIIIFLNSPYTYHIWYETPGQKGYLIESLAEFGFTGLWLGWWLRRKVS